MPKRADERLASSIARVIGARLGEIRRERGLTQRQLAEMLGTQPANVSRAEKGRTALGLSALLRWCRVLDAHPVCALSALDDERRSLDHRLVCPTCNLQLTRLDDGRVMCEGCGRTV